MKEWPIAFFKAMVVIVLMACTIVQMASYYKMEVNGRGEQ